MSKPEGMTDVDTADAVFSALAHPARRQILLSVHYRGSCNAGEIAQRFDCSWPTTSRHLAKLVQAELLCVSKTGRERIYQANSTLLSSVLQKWGAYFSSSS